MLSAGLMKWRSPLAAFGTAWLLPEELWRRGSSQPRPDMRTLKRGADGPFEQIPASARSHSEGGFRLPRSMTTPTSRLPLIAPGLLMLTLIQGILNSPIRMSAMRSARVSMS